VPQGLAQTSPQPANLGGNGDRNEKALDRVRAYIANNPARSEDDSEILLLGITGAGCGLPNLPLKEGGRREAPVGVTQSSAPPLTPT
jgi:hypothetical protein